METLLPTQDKLPFGADRPEHQILLQALALETGPGTAPSFREALALVRDWDYLLRAALAHGVFPTLYRRLAGAPAGALPPEFLTRLQALYREHARRNLRLTAQLLKILGLLEARGIVAVPFKGPVLAQVAYGDIALRQFIDLDILVRRRDARKVKEVLTGAGYRMRYSFTPKQEERFIRHTCEFTFEHPRWPMLDVHWRFAADFLGGGPDPEPVMARLVPVTLEGKTVPSLAPEDLLLFLCLHGTFHVWDSLGLVSDVAHLVQAHKNWDWLDLRQRAREAGLKRMLLLGLSLAGDLLEAPVPREMLAQAASEPTVSRLKQQVKGRLFGGAGDSSGLLASAWLQMQARDSLRDRLGYAWIRLLRPTVEDWQWALLPDRLYRLYYAVRPLRLTTSALGRASRKCCRRDG